MKNGGVAYDLTFRGEHYYICHYESNSAMIMDDDWDADQAKIDFSIKILLAQRSDQLGLLLSTIRGIKRGDMPNGDQMYEFYRERVKEYEDQLNERIGELKEFDIYHPITQI